MPLAEGGPHRTSSPLGTEPEIALPLGTVSSPDPITSNTNTQQQPYYALSTCHKSDIYVDLRSEKYIFKGSCEAS